jgi:hypothetical protein
MSERLKPLKSVKSEGMWKMKVKERTVEDRYGRNKKRERESETTETMNKFEFV